MATKSFMRLHGVGEIPADHASLVLMRMSSAYYGLWVLDSLVRLRSPRRFHIATKNMRYDVSHEIWVPEASLPPESLELKGVVLQSPGFWEFLGKLNPLEVIRQYLNDRHERKKDHEYRNSIEQERMLIENNILKTKLISDVIQAAKMSGMPDEDIQKIIRDNALLPLLRLESLQDSNVISYAQIARKKNIEEPEEVDA